MKFLRLWRLDGVKSLYSYENSRLRQKPISKGSVMQNRCNKYLIRMVPLKSVRTDCGLLRSWRCPRRLLCEHVLLYGLQTHNLILFLVQGRNLMSSDSVFCFIMFMWASRLQYVLFTVCCLNAMLKVEQLTFSWAFL